MQIGKASALPCVYSPAAPAFPPASSSFPACSPHALRILNSLWFILCPQQPQTMRAPRDRPPHTQPLACPSRGAAPAPWDAPHAPNNLQPFTDPTAFVWAQSTAGALQAWTGSSLPPLPHHSPPGTHPFLPGASSRRGVGLLGRC